MNATPQNVAKWYDRFGQHQRREWVLSSCPVCRALVLPEHEDHHRAYHRERGEGDD